MRVITLHLSLWLYIAAPCSVASSPLALKADWLPIITLQLKLGWLALFRMQKKWMDEYLIKLSSY